MSVATPTRTAAATWWSTLRPLALDLGVPFATYYLALHVLGTSLLTALIATSVVALARTLADLLVQRRLNAMAALVLVVNVAGLALSFVSGSVRLVSGKDAVLSSVIGVAILVSARRGRSVLTEALRPFITRGHLDRDAAWDRLGGHPRFQYLVGRYTVIFGVAFLADCAVRVGCAVAAPVSVLGWVSTVASIGAVVVSCVVGGAVTVEPLSRLVAAEVARHEDRPATGDG